MSDPRTRHRRPWRSEGARGESSPLAGRPTDPRGIGPQQRRPPLGARTSCSRSRSPMSFASPSDGYRWRRREHPRWHRQAATILRDGPGELSARTRSQLVSRALELRRADARGRRRPATGDPRGGRKHMNERLVGTTGHGDTAPCDGRVESHATDVRSDDRAPLFGSTSAISWGLRRRSRVPASRASSLQATPLCRAVLNDRVTIS